MNKIVAAAGAVVVLGGLVAAASRPTRTPRPATPAAGVAAARDGGTRPPGAMRGAGAAVSAWTRCGRVCAQERHGAATQRRAWHAGRVSAREARDRGRLRRHVVAALARRGERAAGVRVGPRRGERMVCADCQPRHAGARRVCHGGLCRDAVTAGRRGGKRGLLFVVSEACIAGRSTLSRYSSHGAPLICGTTIMAGRRGAPR